jgi:tetratricopeptide (TPR) repeat protein
LSREALLLESCHRHEPFAVLGARDNGLDRIPFDDDRVLATALLAQGRYQEADEYAGITADVAAEDDFEPQMRWRMVRARILAQQGEYPEAERLAREALELGEGTDWYMFHASALIALADVLEQAGRASETPPLVETALALYERKGARVEAEASRRRLAVSRRPGTASPGWCG